MRSALTLAAATLALAACSHARRSTRADAPTLAEAAAPAATVAARKACANDDQCGAAELCVGGACVAITPGLAECRASVHFEFDRADVRPEDQAALQRVARCLAALPDERAVVEGNCDERGTTEYNVALGFRRAHAAARYLEDLGVAAGRLGEVSYGKERPLCTDETEACWATNRRADLAPGAEAAAAAEGARPAATHGRVVPAGHRGDRAPRAEPAPSAPRR